MWIRHRTLAALAAALTCLTVGCGGAPAQSPEATPPASGTPARASDPPDTLHLDLPLLDPTTWVRQYLPDRAASGYNLVLYRRRLPILTDMNGRIVHLWPAVRAVSRARLSREGRLLVIARGNLVEEYDWDGNLTWSFELPKRDLTHHDLIQLTNGHYLVLAMDGSTHRNYLSEVDGDGEVVWQWWAAEHLASFPGWDDASRDPAHLNSINELPPNRWFDAGDGRFRPGNILVSARNLNSIFIIDKASGGVVWRHSDGLDYQHEAIMVEPGRFGAGLITVFNNGFNNLVDYRRSRVQAIDPLTGEVEWEYASEFFFSGMGGTARRLPGRNTLINSTHGGRIFEIDARGRIVWELVPQGKLGRAERVPYDHCPQLRALPRPVEIDVSPDHWGPYVDADLYNFVPGNRFGRKKVARVRRKLLPSTDACRDLLLPPAASLGIGCGIVEKDLGGESLRARFELSIGEVGRPPETLIDVTIDENSERPWRWYHMRLHRLAYKKITLCVSTEVEGTMENPERMVRWAYPIIKSKWQTPDGVRSEDELDEVERKLRRQQLEALGYIE